MSSWNKNFEDMTIGELKILHENYIRAMKDEAIEKFNNGVEK